MIPKLTAFAFRLRSEVTFSKGTSNTCDAVMACISFASLKAFIRASSRIIDGNGYYYYNSIKFYKMKSFEVFLSLIENGVISITFKIGYYKTGRRMGEIYDHGTDFSINANDITALYDEIKY